MVHISKERLIELKKIFKEEFKTDLSDEETFDAATRLVDFFDLLQKLDWEDKQKTEELPQNS